MTNESGAGRIGSVIQGKYRIDSTLGAGGMGQVYRACHEELGKTVAIKFLNVTEQADEAQVARFLREARAISAVTSAHIVELFDWGRDAAGQPFLVMELLEGRELRARMEQYGKLPVREAVRFAIQILRGLKRVHAAGIVHRDLKPENVFIVTGDDEELHLKILDFGLSKLVDSDGSLLARSPRLTQAGAVIGTPLYMAPEQVEALDGVDHRVDLWAMGVILYEMLCGAPPFVERSYARLVMAICQLDAAPPSRLNGDVPSALDALLARALRRDPAERFQSADEFLAALGALDAVLLAGSGPRTITERSASSAEASLLPPGSDTSPSGGARPSGGASPSAARLEEGCMVRAADLAGPLDATIVSPTRGGATVWLTDAPLFSLWRGEVASPDRLRIEARDGSVRDLRLEPVGVLRLGRVKQAGDEVNELVYPEVASRLAVVLTHDGVRWWLERRAEC
ncbi:MAG: serine/threonine protein kinase, partial [Myxococcales bacterium]|nr:serine/threonine protein kinase [Myxococcales bacterium]